MLLLLCCSALANKHSAAAPVSFEPVTSSSPYSNLYHAVELPGVLKVISLTSYSPDQEKKGFGSGRDEQYKWLQQELANVSSGSVWLVCRQGH